MKKAVLENCRWRRGGVTGKQKGKRVFVLGKGEVLLAKSKRMVYRVTG